MTVKEIQEIGFEKAVFGGYDMKSVDSFLEKITEEFASLQKENAAIKAKMKVLVNKIEEYQSVEQDMRKTLASAQSIAKKTIEEAEEESKKIRSKANSETEKQIATAHSRLIEEEKKLELAQKSTSLFVARVAAVYEAQVKALNNLAESERLPEIKAVPTVAKPAVAPVSENKRPVEQAVAQDVAAMMDKDKAEQPIAQDATRKFNLQEVELGNKKETEEKNFDFGELKFGSDYNPKTDKKQD